MTNQTAISAADGSRDIPHIWDTDWTSWYKTVLSIKLIKNTLRYNVGQRAVLRKQQNPRAVPEDAAVLRHWPHELPWEFGTWDIGVTGLIPCFVSTTVLLHLIPPRVICLLTLRQEWENREDRVARGCSRGARAQHQVARGCRRRMRWRHSPLPQEDANKYPHCHPDLYLPPRGEFLWGLGKSHSSTRFSGKAGGQKRHLPPFESLKP